MLEATTTRIKEFVDPTTRGASGPRVTDVQALSRTIIQIELLWLIMLGSSRTFFLLSPRSKPSSRGLSDIRPNNLGLNVFSHAILQRLDAKSTAGELHYYAELEETSVHDWASILAMYAFNSILSI
ncbi:hypothetical protein QAD02_005756 [Eretmocerus hayati]|uniref:Uncharacterized protein n=1 Tax=Eretmocerus hayati TaxID=131215 RepID=A0ACC2NW24_9HYME|nr:hypothetical protein QAD02_005756 [Eretmocerus hayati]